MEVIVEHGHWAQVSYRRLISETYGRGGWGPLPPDIQIIGTINASINHGRWIAECPIAGCGAAYIADSTDPLFICYQCGRGWYTVIFPPQKTAIEQLLLRRPRVGNHPSSRNWIPGETVAMLAAENARRGIR
jgi:hypothetical protein